MHSPPGAGLALPQLHLGANPGLTLLSTNQTFSVDWVAPGEEKRSVPKLVQLGQTGKAGSGRRGAGSQPASAGLPGWSCWIVLSWPPPGCLTQTRLGARGGGGGVGAQLPLPRPLPLRWCHPPSRQMKFREAASPQATPRVQASPTDPGAPPHPQSCQQSLAAQGVRRPQKDRSTCFPSQGSPVF